jgi:glycosyltransferase involved in cell wall biosynthesis
MACGAPVVCSNAASLPEVVGDAGLLVNPTDTKELTLALRRVLEEPDLRRRLSQQSLARASLFSWKKAAEQLKDLYQSIYTTKNRPQMRTAK